MKLNDIDIRTPEQISLKFQLAGLGSRSAAFMIDVWILIFIESALGLAMYYFKDWFWLTSSYLIAFLIFIAFMLWWLYFAFFEFFASGKTPGKRLLGIRVIQENGQNVTLLSAFIRNLLRMIDFLPALFFVGILMIFFHPSHKRVGDLASGTMVIHERKRRKKRKQRSVDKVLAKKGIPLDHIALDDWSKKKITSKEWELLNTYVNRSKSLSSSERNEMTTEVAKILFPILNLSLENQSPEQLENDLLAVYIQLRDDWEYELI
ncbi:MAG TPA: RDD family protein [Bacillales bacterium]|nr:RDD family protein [Bacillales bacterium]